MSEYERKHWVEAMGGTWPAVNTLQRIRADSVEENLNSLAFTFLKDCLAELEDRGLNDQGLYRVGGVVSKVKKLLNQGLDPQPGQASLDLGDPKVRYFFQPRVLNRLFLKLNELFSGVGKQNNCQRCQTVLP